MSSQKNSYQFTLQVIADILSYENSVTSLQEKITSNSIDWEQFVYIASDYLVLTTCYCRLKQKSLVEFIPSDLASYLEDITSINRNRNLTLLKEMSSIASLLNSNNINYAFLKGSALLIKGCYKDLGERMLGDIDILVEENQIHACYELLTNTNYTATTACITARHFDYKHLPRLQSDTYLAAVEIHKKVLSKSYHSILDPKQILDQKKYLNHTYVPNNNHLMFHTIMNFQANDAGYRYSRISFKSIYDLLILRNMYDYDVKKEFNATYFKHYFSIGQIFFKDFKDFKTNRFINRMFLLKLKHPILRKFIDGVLHKLQFLKVLITSRVWAFITNKNYRNELLVEKSKKLGISVEKS